MLGAGSAVGVRVIDVLEPFPHVARHIEVSVGARAAGARTDIGGSGAGVNAPLGVRWVVSPRVGPCVGTPSRFFPLRFE